MIFEGQSITVELLEDGIAVMCFDRQKSAVNKFDQLTLKELADAIQSVKTSENVEGLIVTSGKTAFIVGADITEFIDTFALPDDELKGWVVKANSVFNSFEDLPIPTVAAINGLALGGGFEMCLAADYRIMSNDAKVGLPEVKLGLFPGFGGTVRLSRLVGPDNAIEWICLGSENNADESLKIGAVDAIVKKENLLSACKDLIQRTISGELDYNKKREEKKIPIPLPQMEQMMTFTSATGLVSAKAGPHYPAPVEAIKTMQKHVSKQREKALEIEAKGFVKVAKTPVARNLVGLFLNDQALKKSTASFAKQGHIIQRAAVLGAGIMGGGIAYQTASKGLPIVMKDVNQSGLDLGLKEAELLFSKQVARKKINALAMGQALNRIVSTLSYDSCEDVDIVVEAVIENVNVKKAVLSEAESKVKKETVLTSNTSTISITELASGLSRPENFCGMHFFNPVHRMPLVEIIRGSKTSDETIGTVVNFAKAIGKTPVIVNDCPGFFVNRVLFPYLGGFAGLLRDGASFIEIDKVMERFGWPMGPAYLVDVIGIDTCVHAEKVMAEGFPERMSRDFKSAVDVLFENERFGQKNKLGFYKYVTGKKDKLEKKEDENTHTLIKSVSSQQYEFSAEEIIDLLMIPMCLEVVRCYEDGIVATPSEADMGLVYGIGFPPFRGGALRYIDEMGLENFVNKAKKYHDKGALYHVTDKLQDMAEKHETFFDRGQKNN